MSAQDGALDRRLEQPWALSRGELHRVLADHYLTKDGPAPLTCAGCGWVPIGRQADCRSWAVATALLSHSRPRDWRADDSQPAPTGEDDAPGLFALGEAS